MNIQQNYNELKQLAENEGMSLFGVADIESIKESFYIPQKVVSGLKYGICIGYRLSKSILNTIDNAPNQLYYFHYQRINILLDQTSLKLTSWIQKKGFNAFPVPASQVTDWERQIGVVSHRQIAKLAGIGWIGRSNLLVTKQFGSQLRLATILTDLPITVDKPNEDSCESCRACIEVCPAKAIGENSYNLEACSKQLKEFIKTQKIGQMICGVCVNVCGAKNGK